MSKEASYRPPYEITPSILTLVAEIAGAVGRFTALGDKSLTPKLRRENLLRSIQASLAIENNTLTLTEVTAVLNGRRVAGSAREIQEVKNAFAAYEALEGWSPTSTDELLAAHKLMMTGLMDDAGHFRSGSVGVFKGGQLVHMAPPAKRIPFLMGDLMAWLAETKEHPLVASSLFHYEFEFIHPFSDGNGRMGRLWQTVILKAWKPPLAYLPVETVIKENQSDYYAALAQADKEAKATIFIEFMLQSLLNALNADQVSDQVTDQVRSVIKALRKGPLRAADLMAALGLSHRPTFRKNYLDPALKSGWVERTEPDSPKSPTQKYRLTDFGREK
ncbi:MAG: Fic family protein [Candidatus Adiutrix sp.]|jgi:Fic family protein|nr:Fic family protein [Candidatus Adiutrix sp.]